MTCGFFISAVCFEKEKMGKDIIEIKPGFGGVALDVRALMRQLGKKDNHDPVTVVAQRFLQLFLDHGVAISQIPRMVPQLTLDKLRSTEALLPSLTPEVIESASILFGVRLSWLEGVDDRIYEALFCSNQPDLFFEDLAALKLPANRFAVRALSCTKKLDGRNDRWQPLALVLVEKVQDLGSEEINRYRVYGDGWDWSHPPCRLQLKAIARLFSQTYQRPIPLHQVKPEMLQAIIDGKCVPHIALQGCLMTNPSLEDFALSSGESVKYKEADELPAVLDYIRDNELEKLAQLAYQKHFD
jgi:hypothetical protein